MYIGEVRLYNFRSYRNESIRLSPGVNVILGPNNAGKTNFLHALNLLFGESYPNSKLALIHRGHEYAWGPLEEGYWFPLL